MSQTGNPLLSATGHLCSRTVERRMFRLSADTHQFSRWAGRRSAKVCVVDEYH
jgi:hypothetical protein